MPFVCFTIVLLLDTTVCHSHWDGDGDADDGQRYAMFGGCATAECEGLCPEAFQCPEGTANFFWHPCSRGFYCPDPGTIEPTICPEGSWCPEGASVPWPCGPGRYGATTGLTDFECSGNCKAGFWCKEGSKSNTADLCPEGR